MKKVGVVKNVVYKSLGDNKNGYGNLEALDNLFMSELTISIVSEKGSLIDVTNPKTLCNSIFYLGNLVEYDEENNQVDYLDHFRELTKKEMKDLNRIYQIYLRKLKQIPSLDSFVQDIKKCNSLNEVKNVLSLTTYKKPHQEIVNISIILDNIKKNMTRRNVFRETEKKRTKKK